MKVERQEVGNTERNIRGKEYETGEYACVVLCLEVREGTSSHLGQRRRA